VVSLFLKFQNGQSNVGESPFGSYIIPANGQNQLGQMGGNCDMNQGHTSPIATPQKISNTPCEQEECQKSDGGRCTINQ
jgi:hypothetical protein